MRARWIFSVVCFWTIGLISFVWTTFEFQQSLLNVSVSFWIMIIKLNFEKKKVVICISVCKKLCFLYLILCYINIGSWLIRWTIKHSPQETWQGLSCPQGDGQTYWYFLLCYMHFTVVSFSSWIHHVSFFRSLLILMLVCCCSVRVKNLINLWILPSCLLEKRYWVDLNCSASDNFLETCLAVYL